MNNTSFKRTVGLLLIAAFCGTGIVWAQSTVSENKSFKSTCLKGKDVQYSVYLPESYGTSDRAYPVLYLLHGYSDSHTSWVRRGQVKQITDKLVAEGKSEEMIIVMPNAKITWYVNNANGTDQYEDMFFQELIPHIEATYRAISEKESRAVAGLSMGGHGALIYILRHPDMFVASFPMSAAVFTDEEILSMPQAEYDRRFKSLYGESRDGKSRLTPYWKGYSTIDLIKNMPEADKRKLKIYVTCGDDDFLFKGNAALWVALREANIPSEFRVRNGGHSWSYWRETLEDLLPVVSGHFHRM